MDIEPTNETYLRDKMIDITAHIKSFVRREGRFSDAQKNALETLWPKYGVETPEGNFNFSEIFSRDAPVILEIGFGNGDSLIQMAVANPLNNYFGIEVYRPGVGALLQACEKNQSENLRVCIGDAVAMLRHHIPDASLSGVQIFFPDPWPKKRHHKRRLIQRSFVSLLIKKLQKNSFIHCATDWENYAEQMMEVMSAQKELTNKYGEQQFAKDQKIRPETKFERRGEKLGHGIWDLVFTKE